MGDRWKFSGIAVGLLIVGFVLGWTTAPPLNGFGATMLLIKRLCGDDPEALDLIDRVVQRPAHRIAQSDSVTDNNVISLDPKPEGNSKQRAIRTLREKRPEIHTRVLAGELSPHGGMIEAGFPPSLTPLGMAVETIHCG